MSTPPPPLTCAPPSLLLARQPPWLVCGDFNMIRYASEKNNSDFHISEAEAFNDMIHDLCLIELPLLDRSFAWSNKREIPTLERLDRAFINLSWDATLPNTNLSSLTRSTSDHVPLKIEISTSIPKPSTFHFDNTWALHPSFLSSVAEAWNIQNPPAHPTAALVRRLKSTRAAAKDWRKHHESCSQREVDCKIVIKLLDIVEETRPLTPAEATLRSIITNILARTIKEKLLY